jgi:hypothetical protein
MKHRLQSQGTLDRYIRNRLRAMQLKKWKKPKKFQRMLRRAGFAPSVARKTWMITRTEILNLSSVADRSAA